MSQPARDFGWCLSTMGQPRQAQQEEKGFSSCQATRNPSLPSLPPQHWGLCFFFVEMELRRQSRVDSFGPGPEGSAEAAEH